MSRSVKALVRKELVRRLRGVDSLTVLSLMGIDGVSSNQLRRELRASEVSVRSEKVEGTFDKVPPPVNGWEALNSETPSGEPAVLVKPSFSGSRTTAP